VTTPIKKLVVYLDETDMMEDIPLYEAIVRRLLYEGVSGATVQTGIMGFGSHQKVHRKRLFGVADDRPILIIVIEEEAKLRQVIPIVRSMLAEGLITLENIEVIP
jgi:uncharacterized protein